MDDLREHKISKITKKYQATIPQAIREILDIKSGDCVVFEIENGQVILKKVSYFDKNYLDSVSSTLNEWLSSEDEEAYHDL